MATLAQPQRSARPQNVLTANPDASVVEAARIMSQHRVGCLLVVSGQGHLIGILTERDIIRRVVACSRDPGQTTVADIMNRKVMTCSPTTPPASAQRIMARYGIRHLPIVEGKVPVGMISIRDVLARQLAEAEARLSRQGTLLKQLESAHPGITRLVTDSSGRVII